MINQKSKELIELIEQKPESWQEFDHENMQKLFESLIEAYVSKLSSLDPSSEELLPLRNNHRMDKTNVAIFADKILRAGEIDIFELQIWRNMGATR